MNNSTRSFLLTKFVTAVIMVILLAAELNSSHASKFVETAKFSLPGQTQVLKFVATKDRVYASVRYRLHSGGKRRSALAAWTPTGKLLWRMETEEAYQLTLADTRLVLAYEQDAQYKRGLIWIDTTDGKEIRRIPLSGRPFSPQYFPREKTYVLYTYPMDHGQKPTILAYDLSGKLIWSRETLISNYSFLKEDNKVLVIRYRGKGDQSVERIDPANGATIWKKTWKDPYISSSRSFESVPIETQIAKPALDKVVYVRHDVGSYDGKSTNWGEFLNLETGKTVAKIKGPETSLRPSEYRGFSITPLGQDRLYQQWHDLTGPTLGAIAFPTGQQIWADTTHTVSSRPPVQWEKNAIFMCRRLSKGLTGGVVLVEMRVYDREGNLIAHHGTTHKNEAMWNDTVEVQSLGKLLYAVKGNALVAIDLRR